MVLCSKGFVWLTPRDAAAPVRIGSPASAGVMREMAALRMRQNGKYMKDSVTIILNKFKTVLDNIDLGKGKNILISEVLLKMVVKKI